MERYIEARKGLHKIFFLPKEIEGLGWNHFVKPNKRLSFIKLFKLIIR